ncbi:hypothetical protein SAMN02745163_04195 [Clostridium cavendishii DSM 21758]|uniref:Uncharacterized protein n=1 Tax=Clostridium cavendishii DSM 21758 TaxID=1121302 RepID=A0A1M6U6Y9_9CLOT|nr:hypothetical protein [Clostridium cavendishii]SHK64926.1 hypothetical protein SAMN02745163_04195 [Clostridium cavendishii DSM 21758]
MAKQGKNTGSNQWASQSNNFGFNPRTQKQNKSENDNQGTSTIKK